MTDQNTDRDERLARLVARSGAAKAQPPVATPVDRLVATPMDRQLATPVMSAPRARRRHPALAGRIAVAGIGVSTMLGMVGAFTLSERAAAGGSVTSGPVATQPVQVVVVIHPATSVPGTGDGTVTTVPGLAVPAVAVPTVAVPAATAPPVVLTAKPQVQPAPASAPAPQQVVKTSGSK
jgi:hypothetical protein